MLTQDVVVKPNSLSDIFERSLNKNITEILHSYSCRSKNKETYIVASLDSLLSFKIQLKFTKTHLLSKGTLVYTNGKPISIPEVYKEILLKKLQLCFDVPVRFYYTHDIDGLVFQYSEKLNLSSEDQVNMLSTILKPVISKLGQVHSTLAQFGLAKKLSKGHLKTISKKIILQKKTAEIITSNQQLQSNQNILRIDENTQRKRKGSVFKYCSEIQQIDKAQMKVNDSFTNVKKGGYFQIEKKICKITPHNQTTKKFINELAVKKKMKKFDESETASLKKIERQLKILYQIQNPQHSLAYWVINPQKYQNNKANPFPVVQNKMFMEYVQQSLDDCIYQASRNITDIVNYSRQIIEGVKILHQSGIVHRDLKPQNVLIQSNKNNNISLNNSKRIKIIDFGESSLMNDNFKQKRIQQQQNLGATLPYSPLQCYISCQQGYNSQKIDLWSIGIIIYQLLFRKNPLTYSRCFATDIYRGWRIPQQFSIFPNIRTKNGVRRVQQIINVLTLNSVCISQKQRINLQKMSKLINQIEIFLQN